jgi:hypothetical protein
MQPVTNLSLEIVVMGACNFFSFKDVSKSDGVLCNIF